MHGQQLPGHPMGLFPSHKDAPSSGIISLGYPLELYATFLCISFCQKNKECTKKREKITKGLAEHPNGAKNPIFDHVLDSSLHRDSKENLKEQTQIES